MPANFLPNSLPLLCATLLGFFTLLKDWKAHDHLIRRFSVLTLLFVALIAGLANQWHLSKHAETVDQQARDDKTTAHAQIKALQDSINLEQDARRTDAQQFLTQLSNLYDKVGTLQTDEKTKQLKQELADLQVSLKTGIIQAPYGNLAKRCQDLGTGIFFLVVERKQTKPDFGKDPHGFWEWYRINDGLFRYRFYGDAKTLQKDLSVVNVKDRRLDELIAEHERDFVERNKISPQIVADNSMMYHLSIEKIEEIGQRFKFLAAQIPHQ